MLLIFFLIIGIVISAALVYYAERIQYNPDNDFTSIPVGLVTWLVLRPTQPSVPAGWSFNPGRTVVGDCNDDDSRVRRHDAQDLPRHGGGLVLRTDWRAHNRSSGSGNRLQLRAVLLAHAGAGQAAQEAPPRAAGRAGATQDGWRWSPSRRLDPTDSTTKRWC